MNINSIIFDLFQEANSFEKRTGLPTRSAEQFRTGQSRGLVNLRNKGHSFVSAAKKIQSDNPVKHLSRFNIFK